MSARKGFLHPPSNYPTTTMTCPNNQAANPFFVDSLINARSESGSYYQSNGLYLPPTAEYPYGLPGAGSCFPGIAKRNEPSAHIPASAPYVQGMETWLEPSRSCRVEQQQSHGAQHMTQCPFTTSIKEENAYCLYEPDKCPKAATVDDISYSGGSTVPVPGYFRLSQTSYTSSRVYHDAQSGLNCSPERVARLNAPTVSQQQHAASAERTGEESHEEAPRVPDRDEDSRPSSEVSSSPEPTEATAESPEKPAKGEQNGPQKWR